MLAAAGWEGEAAAVTEEAQAAEAAVKVEAEEVEKVAGWAGAVSVETQTPAAAAA